MKTVERKMIAVQERVARLRQLADRLTSFDDYHRSDDARDIAERNLQIAIEACLDIGKIIISQKKLPEPKDYRGVFSALAQAHIIRDETTRFLSDMAGARNILVHGYDKVDNSLIYGILKRHLGDFDIFLNEVRDNYLLKA
ncbi:MAG TPA: DUF86 domain-containing protein [Desulfobacterales bacterium]|jgi:uncharacterized protein YutE (UPF0331/DUF86 family)|nr:DUF86 domain-containing protein [Desulfobacterales bacterium]